MGMVVGMLGRIFIANTSAYAVIDSRVSHSFIVSLFVKKLDVVLVII